MLMASQSQFGGLIVQGGVSSGLLNAIVAGGLPGPGSVFLGVEWPFVKAAEVDKEITRRVEITSVHDDNPILRVSGTRKVSRPRRHRRATYTVPPRRR